MREKHSEGRHTQLKSSIEISFIIPLYKVEKYIERCLESIFCQTFTNYEVILVDDFSQDNSLKIAEQFLIDNNISFQSIQHTSNQKQGTARNNGFKIAKGKYIFFMDADDELACKNAIQILYTEMKRGNYDFVTGKEQKILPRLKFKRVHSKTCETTVLREQEIINALCKNHISPVAWNKLINKEFLTQNNIQFVENTYFEDIPYCYILCDLARKVAFLNQITYNYYFQENQNATTNILGEEKVKDAVKMCDELMGYAKTNRTYEKTEMSHIHRYISKSILYVLAHPSLLEDKVKWKKSYALFQEMYNNSFMSTYKKYLYFPVDISYLLIKHSFQRKRHLIKGTGLVKRTILKLPIRLNFG